MQPTKSQQVTQTVYGFLDFTTTIGDTVMVFSPSSSPVAGKFYIAFLSKQSISNAEYRLSADPVKASVTVEEHHETPTTTSKPIETSPIADVDTPKNQIKPSKTIKSIVQSAASSVVHVVAASYEEADDTAEEHEYLENDEEEFVEQEQIVEQPTPKAVYKVQAVAASKVETVVEDVVTVPASQPPIKVIATKVQIVEETITKLPKHSTLVDVVESQPAAHTVLPQKVLPSPASSSVIEIHASEVVDEPILPVENNLNDPEYEFLSRQPSEFAEETYRLHNIKPTNSKYTQKTKSTIDSSAAKKNVHPTGLVTKLGGTVIKDGATTVHETSVIGTYISGKYAQVLQSTSQIYQNTKPKIAATSSLRILKTAAPHLSKTNHLTGDALAVKQLHASTAEFSSDDNGSHERNVRRPVISGNSSFKNRFRNNNLNRPTAASKDDGDYVDHHVITATTASSVEVIKPTTIPNYKKNRAQNKFKTLVYFRSCKHILC